MSAGINIRCYEPKDRATVRAICFETGDRGKSIERLFSDREVMADLLTVYYTDFEPGACWVADCDGIVVGYLTGCLDNRHYAAQLSWPVIPRTIWRAFIKGLFFKKQLWRWLLITFKNWQIGGFSKYIPWNQHWGHLHIDIIDQFRGQRIGQRLIDEFFRQAIAAGVKGVYAVTFEDNVPACRFFERQGFTAISRHPRIMPEDDVDRMYYTIVYRKLF